MNKSQNIKPEISFSFPDNDIAFDKTVFFSFTNYFESISPSIIEMYT